MKEGQRDSDALSLRLDEVEAGLVRGFGSEKRVFLREAVGSKVRDVEGREYTDFTSSYGVMILGHGHVGALAATIDSSESMLFSMAGVTPTEAYLELLELLCSTLDRWPKTKAALTATGSDAVDVALKSAWLHTGRPGVICFSRSFHGQTLGVLPFTAQPALSKPFRGFLAAESAELPFPEEGIDQAMEDRILDQVDALLAKEGSAGYGAVLVEPMQNLAGYRLLSQRFASELRRVCDDREAVLIADEVFTGFGRCGYWLLSDHLGLRPDVVCVGKAMTGGWPLAACVGRAELLDKGPAANGMPYHGSTFMGHPVSCLSALGTIKSIGSEGLLERATEIESSVRRVLGDLLTRRSVRLRGKGAAMALDLGHGLRPDEGVAKAGAVSLELRSMGVMTLTNGFPHPTSLPICPPLTIPLDDLDGGLRLVARAVEIVEARQQVR